MTKKEKEEEKLNLSFPYTPFVELSVLVMKCVLLCLSKVVFIYYFCPLACRKIDINVRNRGLMSNNPNTTSLF